MIGVPSLAGRVLGRGFGVGRMGREAVGEGDEARDVLSRRATETAEEVGSCGGEGGGGDARVAPGAAVDVDYPGVGGTGEGGGFRRVGGGGGGWDPDIEGLEGEGLVER